MIIKRDGRKEEFDSVTLRNAISRAFEATYDDITNEINSDIDNIVNEIVNVYNNKKNLSVEEIQDIVEKKLMNSKYKNVAKNYIIYRENRTKARKNTIDDTIIDIVGGTSDYWNNENSNKNAKLLTTQRDYLAGAVSTDATNRYLLPKDIVEAHNEGMIHFHDADYFIQSMHNCCLCNLEDMLQNGTVISGIQIDKPHRFSTACNIATQIIAQICSNQYGGQSINISHLSPFVEESRKTFKKKFPSFTKEQIDMLVNNDIEQGVQTMQYQISTLMTTNGQSPFVTLYMNLADVEEGVERENLAKVIEEILKQRIKGIKNDKGVYITIAFPKLIYALDECNIHKDSKYFYLTELSARCSAKRLVPDYISNKVMKELKNGDLYTCMGAVRGDELVSIKVKGEEFHNIKMEDAFTLIRKNNKSHNNSQKSILSEFKDKCGVYKITHIPSGKYYIGSSKNIARRIVEHKYSTKHYGKLGELYFINDFDLNNFKYEIIEECNIDDLWNTESKYINLDDEKCVNHKDPKNNGNFTSENRILALEGKSYSDYKNKAYTWWEDVKDVYVMSRGEWEVVEKISFNDENSTLKLYEIMFNKHGETQTLHITQDHPLHTNRGRIMAMDLKKGDKIYDSITYEEYEIVSVKETDEKCITYDFTTSNDMFDLSGIISHNCRSFLSVDRFSNTVGNISNAKNFEQHKGHFYFGRFNQGVVTINLVDVACSSNKNEEEFWKIFDERLELCHRALQCRHKRLLGTKSDVAPILWQNGALARLEKGETIDKLLYNGYSTISLGYAGLYECVMYMKGVSHTDDKGKDFALSVMQHMTDKCEEWKKAENIDYSVYGTPIESTTYKFAKCLKKRFGEIKDVTDHDYITNSYHVCVREEIDAFTKLKLESEFQKLSAGGAISYVEIPNMQNNIDAVITLIQYIYETIMYAELNTKSDYCQVCGYEGEIQVKGDVGKLYWECPNCGNTDTNKLNVARRTCGYIGSNFWNQGRTQEIKERVLHL